MAPRPPSLHTTSLHKVGDSLHQSIDSPITFIFSPTTQKINDIPVSMIYQWVGILKLLSMIYQWVGIFKLLSMIYQWVRIFKLLSMIYQWLGIFKLLSMIYQWVGIFKLLNMKYQWVGIFKLLSMIYQWVGIFRLLYIDMSMCHISTSSKLLYTCTYVLDKLICLIMTRGLFYNDLI